MQRLMLSAAVLAVCALTTGCGGGGGGGGTTIDPSTSMIGTWQPISVTADGAPTQVANVMPQLGQVAGRWQTEYRQDGTCTFRAYAPNGSALATYQGTWRSDGGVATVKIAGTTTTINWSDLGNVLTANYTVDGHAVTEKWARIVPVPGGHEPQWIGAWVAQSVERNGVAVPLATWFGWGAGSDSERLQVQADGAMVLQQMAGATVVDSQTGSWATNAHAVRWTQGGVTYHGYWEGQLLVIVMVDPQTGDTIKVTWQSIT